LTGQEFSFDVDVSKLPCGMNGALYLSEMKEDGGKSELNPGGAAYGTGYCDAQCFVTPWVEGVVSNKLMHYNHSVINTVFRETLRARESAATSSTSGRPTLAPRIWPLIPAASRVCIAALATSAVMRVSATRTVAA
jgi:hypothetical protein